MELFSSLLREHRLMLRLAARLELEFDTLRTGGPPNLDLLDVAVDVSVTLLQESHHAKEEQILFRVLDSKHISAAHRDMMNEFVDQHRASRTMSRRLAALRDACRGAEPGAMTELLRHLKSAVGFFRVHIAREETYFFPAAALDYLDDEEQAAMRDDFITFDHDFLYNKYTLLLDQF